MKRKGIVSILLFMYSAIASYAQDFDLEHRQEIITFCEKLNTAYNSKDEEYIKDFFEDGKIVLDTNIQGDSIQRTIGAGNILRNLKRFWTHGGKCRFQISEMEIRIHPSKPKYYSATFKQEWQNEYYSNDGYIFLIFDYSNEEAPTIPVCVWHHGCPLNVKDVARLGDFKLQN